MRNYVHNYNGASLFSDRCETYVFVFEETEHLQLPEDSFAAHEALKDIRQFFQGHSPTIPRICHGPVNYKGKCVINKIKERERERSFSNTFLRLFFPRALKKTCWRVFTL